MAAKSPEPRKRRTWEHILASQSVNYVQRFIIDEGHTYEEKVSDYGYDLVVFTHDEAGYVEEGTVSIQLKACQKLTASGDEFIFDIDVRDYSLWVAEPMPVILILFDGSKRKAYWLYLQRYFAEDSGRKPKPGAKSVRVRIPRRQVLTRPAIRKIRGFKQAVLKQVEGVVRHAE